MAELEEISDSCSRAIWPDRSVLRMEGPAEEVVAAHEASA